MLTTHHDHNDGMRNDCSIDDDGCTNQEETAVVAAAAARGLEGEEEL